MDDRLAPTQLGPLIALDRKGADGSTPIVLLHGYGGDERVMWVFESALPKSARVLALRGLFPAEGEGFRWHVGARWPPPAAAVFDPAVRSVEQALGAAGVSSPALWIGFSQGAALAFCCAAGGLPTRGVACLAGYLPASLPAPPHELRVFWSHGRRDRHVPIGQARQGMEHLESIGTRLERCETDSGHRVGAACLRGLRTWISSVDSITTRSEES